MNINFPDNWPTPTLLVLVGSHAYGTSIPTSDRDYKGFYVAPSEDFWGLKRPNEQFHATELDGGNDVTLWEVGRFIPLCLQVNPAVVEVLYGDQVEVTGEVAEWVREGRDKFLSKRVAHTYKGYAASQIHKSKRDIKRGQELRPKSLMQCLRILLAGKQLLETGEVMVQVGEHLDLLQRVRRGDTPPEEALQMCESLFGEYEGAVAHSPLPEEPDREWANVLLKKIREHGYNLRRGT